MNKSLLTFLLLFLAIGGLGFAQTLPHSPGEKPDPEALAPDALLTQGIASFYAGNNHLQTDKLDSAYFMTREALGIFTAIGNEEWQARALANFGEIHLWAGDGLTGLTLLDSAVRMGRRVLSSNDSTLGFILLARGLGYTAAGDLPNSFRCIKEADEIFSAHFDPYSFEMGMIYHYYLNHYQATAEWDLALENALLSAYAMTKDGPRNAPQIANSLNNVGGMYCQLGDFETGHKYLETARLLYQSSEEISSIANNLDNLSYCFFKMGDIEKAKLYVQQAINMVSPEGGAQSQYGLASHYTQLGNCYLALGDRKNALRCYKKTVELYSPLLPYDSRERTTMLFAAGSQELCLGYEEEGMAHIQEAEQRLLQMGTMGAIADVARELGKLGVDFCNRGQAEKGNHFLIRSMAYWESLPENYTYDKADIAFHLGGSYRLLGQWENCLKSHQKSLKWFFPKFSPSSVREVPNIDHLEDASQFHLLSIALALSSKGIALKEMPATSDQKVGNLTAALEYFEIASKVLDGVIDQVDQISSPEAWLHMFSNLYVSGVRTSIELAQLTGDETYLEQAFLFSERYKAILLRESIQRAGAQDFAGISPDLLEVQRILKVRKGFYEKKYLETLRAAGESDLLHRYETEMFRVSHQLDSLESQLDRDYPAYQKMTKGQAVTSVAQMRENVLENDSAALLLEYVWDDFNVSILGLTTTGLIAENYQIDSTLLEDIQAFRQCMITPPRVSSSEQDKVRDLGLGLYTRLVAPILEKSGPDIEKLIIVPDGPLRTLTFEAMTCTSNPEGKDTYLIEKYPIRYGFSATLLSLSKSGEKSQLEPEIPFMAFATELESEDSIKMYNHTGDDFAELVSTTALLDNLKQQYEMKIFSGKKATESNFKAWAAEAKIVHINAHGEYDWRLPNHSGMLFGTEKKGDEDGILFTKELFNLELNNELVVLSGCNTGFGKDQKGESLMSLSRGFAYAGCHSIVSSLWKANESSTATILDEFYAGLAVGSSKDEALRQAKLAYLEKSDTYKTHPYFWAPLVLIGDADPVDLPEKQSKLPMLLLTSVLALGIIIIPLWAGRNKKETPVS